MLVADNHGQAQWIDFELYRFGQRPGEGTLVPRWCTNTAGGDRYTYHADTYVHGSRFWSWFERDTVQTFEVPNIQP